jgi:putative transposase
MGVYLAEANTRRLKGALAPLLGNTPLSRSAVSRVMRILREQCEAWRTRPLAERGIVYLFLDAIHVRVRVDRRVQVVPVLVALGVTATGEKELLALQLVTSESTAAWTALVEDLAGRGLAAPVLCVIDGNAGLRRALTTTWGQRRWYSDASCINSAIWKRMHRSARSTSCAPTITRSPKRRACAARRTRTADSSPAGGPAARRRPQSRGSWRGAPHRLQLSA